MESRESNRVAVLRRVKASALPTSLHRSPYRPALTYSNQVYMDKLPSFEEVKKKTVAQAESLGLTTLSPGAQAAVFALLGSAGTFGLLAVRRRFLKRIPNSDHVPADVFEKRRWVKGVVTRRVPVDLIVQNAYATDMTSIQA